ncbi:MAG: lipoyl(octanoyl) transferase LipB [Planctomycetes bacterium]|nr:lipoyl(octanoyl) transferase LipB [Planctomycetota bacterium]
MTIEKKLITKTPKLAVYDCGKTKYQPALEMQLNLVEKRIANEIPNTVLLLEHYPTITLGANKNDNKLLQTRQKIAEKNIDLVEVRRGGGTTAHNPGQIVIYPVISLTSLDLGISEYVRQLETIGIELLNTLSISAQRLKGKPGLWHNEKKIASIGVKVKKHVTYHGMAINISNDLDIFKNIVPCGIKDVRMTSVQNETQTAIDIANVKQTISEIVTRLWA